MKKYATIALAAIFSFALVATAGENANNGNKNNGNVGNGQGNTEFEASGGIHFVYPEGAIFVGDEVYVDVALFNDSNRAIPTITLWLNGNVIAAWDNIGSGASVTYRIPVDTSTPGVYNLNALYQIEAWSRKDNKNWAYQLPLISAASSGVIEILESGPSFIDGTGVDSEGNLTITLLGDLLANTNGQDAATVSLDGNVLKKGDWNTNNWSLSVKVKAFRSLDGDIELTVDGELVCMVVVENGTVVGTY